MVSFSEQAVAAYDLLVNKQHGVESETLREVSSSVAGNGDQLSCSAEETYNPPWAPQLEVAGHRGGLVAGGARQAQLWNTLLGTVGCSQLGDAISDYQERKGVFKHSNVELFNQRTSPLPNPESNNSRRAYEPWTWRSQMERLKEERDWAEKVNLEGGPKTSIPAMVDFVSLGSPSRPICALLVINKQHCETFACIKQYKYYILRRVLHFFLHCVCGACHGVGNIMK